MHVQFVYASIIATRPRAGVFSYLVWTFALISIAFHLGFIGDSLPPVSLWLRGRGDRYPRFPKLPPVPAPLSTGLPRMRVLGYCCSSCGSRSQRLRKILFVCMLPHLQIVGRGKDPRSKLGYRGRREPVVQPATGGQMISVADFLSLGRPSSGIEATRKRCWRALWYPAAPGADYGVDGHCGRLGG
jgi:hypothetical protein